MSVDNSELLMLLGGKKKAEQTIGIAGQQGFGVGAYGGSSSDLKAVGLKPMSGCFNPTSENYGNYIHTNGSVMVFIPAFTIRIGNASAPLYSKYGADTIEIGDVELNGKDGWAIPRGFYDGGNLHSGFFIDKYLNSKDAEKKQAISVKNGDPIFLSNRGNPSTELPNCVGQLLDAIELSRARGEHYSLVSCYQWAVISLITQAHAQAATSTEACAWYNKDNSNNHPKGNNNNLKDFYDNTITFTRGLNANASWNVSKTGSAVPLAKTTHNGQVSGICDVNGNMWQPVLGWQNPEEFSFGFPKLSVRMHDLTRASHKDSSLFDWYTINGLPANEYGYWGYSSLYTTNDSRFPLCGVIPKNFVTNSGAVNSFGYARIIAVRGDPILFVAGGFSDGASAGSWYRRGYYYWEGNGDNMGFRAAGYPP